MPIIKSSAELRNNYHYTSSDGFPLLHSKIYCRTFCEKIFYIVQHFNILRLCFKVFFCGKLEIQADDKSFIVTKNESLRFKGDTIHSYQNVGSETISLHMILYNP